MRGAVAAQAEGVFWPYFQAVYRHMWEEPQEDGRSRCDARSAQLFQGSMPTRSSPDRRSPAVKGRLMALTQDAVDRGASARRHSSSTTRCSSARTSFATSRRKSLLRSDAVENFRPAQKSPRVMNDCAAAKRSRSGHPCRFVYRGGRPCRLVSKASPRTT